MYQELQKLKEVKREVHTLDALSFNDVNLENYMVEMNPESVSSPRIALLDNASTHTILRSPVFFESSCMNRP